MDVTSPRLDVGLQMVYVYQSQPSMLVLRVHVRRLYGCLVSDGEML
jgi:hypothetical protein